MKFHLNSFNSCQLKERTRNSTANAQRAITQKYPKLSYVLVHDISSYCALVVSVSCFGVRFSVMFHFMFVHYTFGSVWVAEWPPFGK